MCNRGTHLSAHDVLPKYVDRSELLQWAGEQRRVGENQVHNLFHYVVSSHLHKSSKHHGLLPANYNAYLSILIHISDKSLFILPSTF
jgi:hypothetical protein